MEIENAKITNVSLTMEDHCSLVFFITVEGASWGCNIGGYKIATGMLGAKPEDFKAETGDGLAAMMRIMDVVGVSKWEDLKDKYCRVKTEGWGGTVNEIGNIISDKWFNIKDFFSTYNKKIDYDEPNTTDKKEVNVLGSNWEALEGEGVYECKHCAKLVDIPSQYCPDCGAYMTNYLKTNPS